jgi:DNA-binding NarL/FixJ family response regulator
MSTERSNSMSLFEGDTIVLIENRSLLRECLSRCLLNEIGYPIAAFQDAESWQEVSQQHHPLLFVISIIGTSKKDMHLDEVIRRLEPSKNAPIVVLSDTDDVKEVAESFRHGVRGHIPTATGLDVAVKAIQLVLAGGVYAPASHFWTIQPRFLVGFSEKQGIFTERQFAVLDAVRHGKANKVIARELQISENTVKVHLRNVMRKLGAKNRMEAAILSGDPNPLPSASENG